MGATAMIIGSGETLGGYRICEVIGIGGMAIVYRAEQLSLGREVALKVLAPDIAQDQAFRERFRREGKNIAALDHPNIVTIHDSGEADGRLFLAMRLVRGATLAERMRNSGLTAAETVRILRPIADALDAAHAAGLVHRDVKPQNILVDASGKPYLADFGVAKSATTADLSSTHGFVGTYNYAAPEQILGWPITPAADIYGLTAVLYHCLTGRLPYPRETDGAVLHAHAYEATPTTDPGQPGAARLDALIATGMAKRPGDRFGTAGELIRAAEGIVGSLATGRRGTAPAFIAAAPGSPTVTGPSGTMAEARRDRGRLRRSRTRPVGQVSGGARWLAAAGVVASAIALVVALGATGTTGGEHPRTAAGRPFRISYTRPWRPVDAAPPGAVALAPGQVRLAAGGSTLVAGRLLSSSTVPGGVPPALLARFGRPVVSAGVSLAGHRGRAYTWGQGSHRVTAYVLATGAGDAAIICRGPAPAGARACARLVAKASVAGVTVLAPGPDLALADTLKHDLGPVAAARTALHHLTRATLAARARRAAALAGAERRIAGTLGRLATVPRYAWAVSRLGRALHEEGASFSALAAAARAANRPAYARDVRGLRSASGALASLSTVLATYKLGLPALGPVRLAGLPPTPRAVTSSTPAPQTNSTPAAGSTSAAGSSPAPQAGTSTTIVTPYS